MDGKRNLWWKDLSKVDRTNIYCVGAVLEGGRQCSRDLAFKQEMIEALGDAARKKKDVERNPASDFVGDGDRKFGQIRVWADHCDWEVTIYMGGWIGGDFCDLEAYVYSSKTGVRIPDYSYAYVRLDWFEEARARFQSVIRQMCRDRRGLLALELERDHIRLAEGRQRNYSPY